MDAVPVPGPASVPVETIHSSRISTAYSGRAGIEDETASSVQSFSLAEATISAIVMPGDGPPVLFLHGNSSCKEIWRHQIRLLRRHGRAVLAPDLPGHGQSSNARTPDVTYSFPGYAAVISELLDRLGWSCVDVVGWSLGGHIGLEMLATDPRIHSLAIVGAPPVRPSPEAVETAFHLSDGMQLAGKKEFSDADARNYATQMMGGEQYLSPFILQRVARTDGNARHTMFKNALAGVGADARRLVETTEKPLCIFHGESEPFVRLDYLKSLNYRSLWNDRIYVISQAGHAPHWQNPPVFNSILLEFLDLQAQAANLA